MNLQYNTAELRRELPIIAKSRVKALKRLIEKSYFKATGLTEIDSPALWNFALAKSEPRADPVTEAGLKHQKELGDHIRLYDPTYDADQNYEADQHWMEQLGTPTFCQTAQRLAAGIQDETELARQLEKLLELYSRLPITRKEYQPEEADSDQSLLVRNWIQEPLRKNWAIANLCFYSVRGLAQLLYFLKFKKPLPGELLNKEPERIRKLYQGLGLVAARRPLIKDIKFQAGKIHWIPFKRAIHAG